MLVKSLQDTYNQLESKQVELQTFEKIREHELHAIPRRIDSLTEDFVRQSQREKELQKKFADLVFERDQLKSTSSKWGDLMLYWNIIIKNKFFVVLYLFFNFSFLLFQWLLDLLNKIFEKIF